MFEDEELIDKRKEKDELRAILDKHIAEYLARGGKIRQMEPGAITESFNIHDASFDIRNEKVKHAKEKENREMMVKRLSEKG
jgi:uncharacterized protein (DUF1330 family)